MSIHAEEQKTLILSFSNLLGHNFPLSAFQTHLTMKLALKQQLINGRSLTFDCFWDLTDRLSEHQIKMNPVVAITKVYQKSNRFKVVIFLVLKVVLGIQLQVSGQDILQKPHPGQGKACKSLGGGAGDGYQLM